MLKKSVVNPNRRSAHYKRQSPFEGSDRQVRSRALKLLLEQGALPEKDIPDMLAVDRKRAARIIDGLLREGFLTRRRGVLKIA